MQHFFPLILLAPAALCAALAGTAAPGIEGLFDDQPGMSRSQSYQVYKAYDRLDGPNCVMLRLQPVHIHFEPAPEKNGRPTKHSHLTITARIVETLKGKPLAQPYIRYTIPHEGNNYQGPLGDVGPEVEERLMSTSTKALAAAKGGGDTLDMGFFDWSECPPAKHWNWAIDQAFRICPELRESTPASEQELAAAQQLLSQYPTFVRADIKVTNITLDEQAGEAVVRYHAELRPLLLSGVAKGSTPHERTLAYERRFPLTEAWRARHAAAEKTATASRAILALETDAEGKARVIEAWDAENDEALLRALNEITITTAYRASWK